MAGVCKVCEPSAQGSSGVALGLVALGVVLFLVILYRQRALLKPLLPFWRRAKDNIGKMRVKLKIIVTFFQIISQCVVT